MRYPDDVPTLTDGSVTLRAVARADVPRIVEQCTDPDSVTWTTVPTPYDDSEASTWISEVIPSGWAAHTDLTLAIEHDGAFAGSVSLRPRGPGEAEIGFGLHPGVRGRGVMHRALDLLLDWAFGEQGCAVVHWRANVGNWASRRVAWRIGFTFGPTIPRLLDHRGERVDAWTGWIGAGDARQPSQPWHEVPVLETDRLRLRPWADTDGARLVEAAADPLLRHFIPETPLPVEPAAVAAYLTRVRLAVTTGDRLAWCLADRDTDRALGNVALFEVEGPDGAGAAQVGYWTHPDARGRGLMIEALRVLSAWALSAEGPGLRRVYLLTAAGNTASRRVAEQAGFTHVGTERTGARTADGFEDNAVYDRLATDPSTTGR